MGAKNSKQRDLLEGSAWLRTVVQHHQKRRQGVAGFDSFTIEPVFTPPKIVDITDSKNTDRRNADSRKSSEIKNVENIEIDEIRLFRVDITFRNNKGAAQEVYWIVKAAYALHLLVDNDVLSTVETRSVDRLLHEIKVYTSLLTDIAKFLDSRKNPRSRFLLNIPSLVFHERAQSSGRVVRCHLVIEDVSRTKRCSPMGLVRAGRGMSLSQFKVFLGTLAQFHAVGISWNAAKKDDSALDLFPFLHREPPTSCESKIRRDVLLNRFEKLLLWYFDKKDRHKAGKKDQREIQLFVELKRKADEILSTDLRSDMCDPLGGLCIGNLLPSEVMFQYEASFASLFDLTKNGFDEKKWSRCVDGDDCDISDADNKRAPVCAAVATCHRVHFGHLLRELATLFFIMPEELVRRTYLIQMLQSYCHVLTITMEMLEVDWVRHFKMTFHQVVLAFFSQIPQAILRSIIAHMKLTDAVELDSLVSSNRKEFGRSNPSAKETNVNLQRQKNIPLTPARVEFLIGLLAPVHKQV